jgi:thymidylate synthase (FAD)
MIFQTFCIAGDMLITLELPRSDKGKIASYQRTIEHLYNLQRQGKKLPKYVRVFDEDYKKFVRAGINNIIYTGIKPVYKVSLASGKTIIATKEHKFLTQDGFISLEDAVGLQQIQNTIVMTKQNIAFACNGVVTYQDHDWMKQAKERAIENKTGLQGIAEEAQTSYHTIRKWLKIHGLQFSKKEVAQYTDVWNKDKYGYKLQPHSMETIEKMRRSAKRGEKSNLWKGGADRSERLKIADWCKANRKEFLQNANYACQRCGSNYKLELHHIVTVAENPDLAYEKSNIEVLCKSCHRSHHSLNGHNKTWRERSKGNTLTIDWSIVENVEYMGQTQTYDMEVDHKSHNYVANGIVVHNSQCHAEVCNEYNICET